MVPKAERERLKALVKETLTLLCKNGLPYKSHFSLEALVGITLDKKDVLLVSINENVLGSNEAQPYITCVSRSPATSPHRKRQRQRRYPRRSTATRPPPESDEGDEDNDLEQEDSFAEGSPQAGDTAIKTETNHELGEDGADDMADDDVSSAEESFASVADMSSDVGSEDDPDPAAPEGSTAPADTENPLAGETGPLQEYQQSIGKKKSHHKKLETEQGKPLEPRLNPMTLDESAQIWQRAMAHRREQKDPSPKRRGRKRRSGDASKDDTQPQSSDEKPEAPPMCHICGKTMSTEKNLTKHVRRHLGMFSVYCDECGKGFFDKTDLDSHAAKHANRKLYQCDMCGRSYSHKRGLLKHIRKDHKGSSIIIPEDDVVPHPAETSVQLQQAVESIQTAPDPQVEGAGSLSTSSSQQTVGQASQDADSRLSAQSMVTTQLITPPMQPLTQIPGPASILPHVAHLTQARPDISLHPGLHPMAESAYYYAYPSQSVFPGAPTH